MHAHMVRHTGQVLVEIHILNLKFCRNQQKAVIFLNAQILFLHATNFFFFFNYEFYVSIYCLNFWTCTIYVNLNIFRIHK